LIPASSDARYNRSMKYRKLRIAWSVAWGVAAVLLCVLWVRSYWCRDVLTGPSQTAGESYVFSQQGEMQYLWDSRVTPDAVWQFSTYPVQDWHTRLSAEIGHWYRLKGFCSVVVPHWAFLLSVTAIAASSWLSYRFSLRTLLIATTLVAVVLGLIVWLART
jgi:hypothetical protein